MKTLIRPAFLPMVTFALVISVMLLAMQPAQAQYRAEDEPARIDSTTVPIPPGFKASLFHTIRPLVLQIVFENPTQTALTMVVKDENHEVIFQKQLGSVKIYKGSIHVAGLADGEYTMEIKGKTAYYAKAFQVGTQVGRLAQVR